MLESPTAPPSAQSPHESDARFGSAEPSAGAIQEPAVFDAEPDASEAQLEDVLARWEPELGPEEPQAPAVADDSEDEVELELEAADDTGVEIESIDDGDLVLSADDEVADVTAPSIAEAVESEDDVDLAFLEFGEDDVAPAEDPAAAAAAAEAVERDVSAALVESHGDYIDIGTALGGEPDELELPMDAIADEAETAQDEAEAAIDAAFDFDGIESAGAAEAQMSGPSAAQSPAESSAGAPAEDERAADIAFVDSLLMDAESLFDEEPADASVDGTPDSPSADAQADPFDDVELDDIAAEADRPDDYGQDDDETGDADSDLIDLDTFRGFTSYEPPAPSTGDVSSLTLHPMFFEEDPSEMDGGEHEESRHDQWSSSGGG